MSRRARNIISRTRELALAAADLLDQGLSDADVAGRLNEEFAGRIAKIYGRAIAPRTVGAFRKRDYAEVADERIRRRERADKVRLLVEGAGDESSTYSKAGQALLARMIYEVLESEAGDLDGDTLKGLAKTLSKIREIEISQAKVEMERARQQQADQAAAVAGDEKLSPEERTQEIRRLFGLS